MFGFNQIIKNNLYGNKCVLAAEEAKKSKFSEQLKLLQQNPVDEESLQDLTRIASKYRFHVDGEGGEYETLVVAGPHMVGELEIDYVKHWDGVRGHLAFQ